MEKPRDLEYVTLCSQNVTNCINFSGSLGITKHTLKKMKTKY